MTSFASSESRREQYVKDGNSLKHKAKDDLYRVLGVRVWTHSPVWLEMDVVLFLLSLFGLAIVQISRPLGPLA